jgi:hypothetical protein
MTRRSKNVHMKVMMTIYVVRIFLGVKGGRHLRLITSLPSVSRLSRENVAASMSHNSMGLHSLLQGYLYHKNYTSFL